MGESVPSNEVLATRRECDPASADLFARMARSRWQGDVLPRKLVELVSLAVNIACTELNADGTRRHINGTLDAGASRDEIPFVIKCASAMAIHSCGLGAPILLEEAQIATPAADRLQAIGQWNNAWNPFLAIDRGWTDAFMATGGGTDGSGVISPKDTERRSVAFDASFTHIDAPDLRPHVRNALKAGSSVKEIFEVLKTCVSQGARACNLGVPLLEEELALRQADGRTQPEGAVSP